MNTSIWWIRRDLRLHDNPALSAAAGQAEAVIPLFILDPHLLTSPYCGEKRLSFLLGGLRTLDESLRRLGNRLIVRKGEPEQILRQVLAESDAQAVYAAADYSPYARRRDQSLTNTFPIQWTDGSAALSPGEVLKPDGTPYTVFTPFSKTWRARWEQVKPVLLKPPQDWRVPPGIESLPLPENPRLSALTPFPPSEKEALQRLDRFTIGPPAMVYEYAESRNRLDIEGTSQLSPYLRFGMLSPRQAVWAAYQAITATESADGRWGAETWLNELIWREFYIHILYHFPRVRRENFRLTGMSWLLSAEDLAAWQTGRTGYPVVDAAMRQLTTTGWMHNRARMIVASFLTKDLLLDWRQGELFFMQHLVDGDPAANNGGWQWIAGTGTDAAPYYRIFNPVSQSKKFDPQGDFIRRWLPELARVPLEYIHTPWEMPETIQKSSGCRIGVEYPAPVINHSFARQRVLEAYQRAQGKKA